jgi:hypothetical protein
MGVARAPPVAADLTMRRHRTHLETMEFWWRLLARTRPLWPWLGRRMEDVRLRRRRGRIAVDPALRAAVIRELKPLDILLERTTFHLADLVIPGHFHHAGIFLGRLDDLGHRLPHALELLERRDAPDGYVIEATHQGVRLVTLDTFLDVDALAVLRDRSLHPGDHDRLYASATHELGKQYDYYFNLDDPGHQFCSKLVTTIFSHLDFRLHALSGLTLVPDHLVQKALIDPAMPLTPILIATPRQGLVFDHLRERLAHYIGVDRAALEKAGDGASPPGNGDRPPAEPAAGERSEPEPGEAPPERALKVPPALPL